MSEKMRFVLQGRVTDTEAFVATAKRMVQQVEADEPGTIAYEWFVGEGDRFLIHDLYADEDAFLAHFGAATESGDLDAFMSSCAIEAVSILTEPKGEQAKAIAAQFGALQFHGIGGVAR